jgi:hypothetical protein
MRAAAASAWRAWVRPRLRLSSSSVHRSSARWSVPAGVAVAVMATTAPRCDDGGRSPASSDDSLERDEEYAVFDSSLMGLMQRADTPGWWWHRLSGLPALRVSVHDVASRVQSAFTPSSSWCP